MTTTDESVEAAASKLRNRIIGAVGELESLLYAENRARKEADVRVNPNDQGTDSGTDVAILVEALEEIEEQHPGRSSGRLAAVALRTWRADR